LFVTCFVHNVAATVSYDRKEFLNIRTAIAHIKQDKEFFFNESDGRNILLQTPDQVQIPQDSLEMVSMRFLASTPALLAVWGFRLGFCTAL
jgi:hypothetical protein